VLTTPTPDTLQFRTTGQGWARIFLIADAKGQGHLIADSDWGNYAYWWGGIPKSETPPMEAFLQFLLEVEKDPHYFIRKLSPKDVYDPETTLKAITEYLDEQELDGRDMALEREHLPTLDDSFESWAQGTNIECAHEFYMTTPDPQAVQFVHKILVEGLVPAIRERIGEAPTP